MKASAWLCGIFESGMREAKERTIRLEGAKSQLFECWLECAYLEPAGAKTEKADGRELFLLFFQATQAGISQFVCFAKVELRSSRHDLRE